MIVITGPSGAGKGTLIRALLPRVPDVELAVSATTRLRRDGEVEGRDYYYLSEADFARRVANGELPRAHHVRLGPALRDAARGGRADRADGQDHRPRARDRGRAQGRRGASRRRHRLRDRAARRARAPAARAGDRERRRDRRAARPGREPAPPGQPVRLRGRERRPRPGRRRPRRDRRRRPRPAPTGSMAA